MDGVTPGTHDPFVMVDPDPDVVLATVSGLDELDDALAQCEVAVEIVMQRHAVAGP